MPQRAYCITTMNTTARKTSPGSPDWPDLPSAAIQVENFRQARQARRQERVDDYVELIADLIREKGEARQVDLAERIGVKQPTVAKMLRRLADQGYVVCQRYRGPLLTAAGERLALASRSRHQVVEQVLLALGVDAGAARRDAEGIEHHVSAATLQAFRRFLDQRG